MTIYQVYTDGSCAPNPGRGGWAYVIVYPSGYIDTNSGAVFKTTNNRMELRAVLEVLKSGKNIFKSWDKIRLYTDSNLIVQYNSRGQGKKNRDMVDELIELNTYYKSLNIDVEYVWIKGHSNIEWNEFVDNLALEARLCK